MWGKFIKLFTIIDLECYAIQLQSLSKERFEIRRKIITFLRNNWQTTDFLGIGQKKSYSDKKLIEHLHMMEVNISNITDEIEDLKIVSNRRKKCRKNLMKFIRDNIHCLINDTDYRYIIRKANLGYLSDLTDDKLISCSKLICDRRDHES